MEVYLGEEWGEAVELGGERRCILETWLHIYYIEQHWIWEHMVQLSYMQNSDTVTTSKNTQSARSDAVIKGKYTQSKAISVARSARHGWDWTRFARLEQWARVPALEVFSSIARPRRIDENDPHVRSSGQRRSS